MESLKTTALTDVHRSMGAKMVPFAGYEMPVQYAGLLTEHHAVRNAAGLFDVSHMGEFTVEGPDALDFLQYVTSNDVSKLVPGKVQYSCLPNADSGIVDDLLVYCRGEQKYLLVVNASNIDKDWAWLQQWAPQFDVHLENQSELWSLLALQGPHATALLQPFTSIDLGGLAYYSFAEGELLGFSGVILSATGYTGAGGFELYLPNDAAETVWKTLLDAGAVPVGLGARDTLRLEMGYCLYGNDIDDTTNALEAGLGWITKFSKDFIQKPHLENVKAHGVERKLVGFVLTDRGVARHGYPIVDESGTAVGVVTSGSPSPTLGQSIGLGYVPVSSSTPGSKIFVEVRNQPLAAEVVSLPFLKKA
jgi:aminomethyltransferase